MSQCTDHASQVGYLIANSHSHTYGNIRVENTNQAELSLILWVGMNLILTQTFGTNDFSAVECSRYVHGLPVGLLLPYK